MIGGNWRLIFFGSDGFSLAFIKHLRNVLPNGLVKGIVPIKHSVLEREVEHLGLDVVDPEIEEFDFGIVASYGKFIPGRIIKKAKVRMLNVHPSLLPEWRGPAPIQRSIMNGSPLGVSIIDVHPKVIDAGDIYMQKTLNCDNLVSFTQASEKLAVLGAEMVHQTLADFHFITIPQQGESSYAAPITSQDSVVCFKRMTAEQIYRRFLAIGHQKTLRCQTIEGRELLLKDLIGFNHTESKPGEAFYKKSIKTFEIGTMKGAVSISKGILKGKSTLLDAGGIASSLKKFEFL